jgi:ATP-dependent Clp protease ATP-binding subunit ClpC
MFERFTEKALRVILLSQEEARKTGHNFVGTEQLLIGLIDEGTGIGSQALKAGGLKLADAKREVERLIGKGSGFVAVEIPFTPRAKNILEQSLEQAKAFNHSYIGTEHILLALLEDTEGIAKQILKKLQVDVSKLRKIYEIYGDDYIVSSQIEEDQIELRLPKEFKSLMEIPTGFKPIYKKVKHNLSLFLF